ncbi:MAG TPA: GNAT family N-acetyltransferase [Thermoplasmata archaeon]|nr:GNAT family N-acetyltransferase [Thermoplasmata archaeon]
MAPQEADRIAPFLAEERAFVYSFGGYGLELRGGTLVTNERIAVPAFNFVQELRAGRGELTSLLERALDHYFQRALRPTFRVPTPVPPEVRSALERLGFREREEPRTLHRRATDAGGEARDARYAVRPATEPELALFEALWTDSGTPERAEFHRFLELAVQAERAGERCVPLVAIRDGRPVASALAHRFGSVWGLHGLATAPAARGRGAASELALAAWGSALPDPPVDLTLWSASARLGARLDRLGFAEVARYAEFVLPPQAELALTPAAPSPGPRWRPPRNRS